MMIFTILLSVDLTKLFGFDLGKYIIEEFKGFNIFQVINERGTNLGYLIRLTY